jgi:hypothetical protein
MEINAVPSVYIQGLIEEIDRIKQRNGTTLYRINDKLTKEVVSAVKSKFGGKPEYTLTMNRCARCTNQWDVIIVFPKE